MVAIQEKRCTKCKVVKPVTEFYRRRSSPYNIYSHCIACTGERGKSYQHTAEGQAVIQARIERYRANGTAQERRCAKCRVVKPADAFTKNSRNPDGLNTYCKECVAARLETPEAQDKRRANSRRLRALKAEQGICSNCSAPALPGQRLCQKHADYFRELDKRRRNIEGTCQRCSQPVMQPTKYCRNHYVRTVCGKHPGLAVRWKQVLEILERQNYVCPYTGETLALGLNASLDHIKPISRFPELRSVVSNLQWVSYTVNVMKRDMTHDEFLAQVAAIHSYVTRETASC